MKLFTQIVTNDIIRKAGALSGGLSLDMVMRLLEQQDAGSFDGIYPEAETGQADGDYMYRSKEQAEEAAAWIYGVFSALPDPCPVYRSLSLKNMTDLDRDHPGESWSFDKESAIQFGIHGHCNYLLEALLPLSAVDWHATVSRYLEFSMDMSSDDENELVVEDESALHGLKIYPLKNSKRNPSIVLYRGLEKEFNPGYDTASSDAPPGYSTWTDSKALAKQHAGKDGFVYSIEIPLSEIKDEYIDAAGERSFVYRTGKPAGLNGVKGNEYLLYQDHESFNPDMIKTVRSAVTASSTDSRGSNRMDLPDRFKKTAPKKAKIMASTSNASLPPPPGTAPVRDGWVRLYHQTSLENIESIRQEGLTYAHAAGIEGPKAIWASRTPFYGDAKDIPTVEFQVDENSFVPPSFVTRDVPPEDILAIHEPWHSAARYILKTIGPERILSGEYDDLPPGSEAADAVAWIKCKYATANAKLTKTSSITVFHGTKYDFDKFRTEFVGKGEGGRAYGWGIYFGGVKDVAEYYRNQQTGSLFPPKPDNFTVDGTFFEKRNGRYYTGNGDEISKDEYGRAFVRAQEDHERRLEGGFIYTVEIDAEHDDFIDWDKKLSEQGDGVKAALKKMAEELNFHSPFASKTEKTGREVYRWAVAAMADGDVNRASAFGADDQMAASKYLFKMGIPGIRYLDARSRNGGTGTYNYVVFDPSLLKVEKKEGKFRG